MREIVNTRRLFSRNIIVVVVIIFPSAVETRSPRFFCDRLAPYNTWHLRQTQTSGLSRISPLCARRSIIIHVARSCSLARRTKKKKKTKIESTMVEQARQGLRFFFFLPPRLLSSRLKRKTRLTTTTRVRRRMKAKSRGMSCLANPRIT